MRNNFLIFSKGNPNYVMHERNQYHWILMNKSQFYLCSWKFVLSALLLWFDRFSVLPASLASLVWKDVSRRARLASSCTAIKYSIPRYFISWNISLKKCHHGNLRICKAVTYVTQNYNWKRYKNKYISSSRNF